jgi:hypothetical protein
MSPSFASKFTTKWKHTPPTPKVLTKPLISGTPNIIKHVESGFAAIDDLVTVLAQHQAKELTKELHDLIKSHPKWVAVKDHLDKIAIRYNEKAVQFYLHAEDEIRDEVYELESTSASLFRKIAGTSLTDGDNDVIVRTVIPTSAVGRASKRISNTIESMLNVTSKPRPTDVIRLREVTDSNA